MTPSPAGPAPLNVEVVRKDFPLLTREVHGRPIVYLDSATSSSPGPSWPRWSVLRDDARQRPPRRLRDRRGGDEPYEAARVLAGRFIGAPDPAREIVFTKNTTESLNLVAHSWGRTNLRAGDVVLLTEMEHHANLVPWLQLADERAASNCGTCRSTATAASTCHDLDRLVDGVKLVGVSAMSNVLGTINPLVGSATPRTPPARSSSPTPPSPSPTCRSTSPRSGSTSWRSGPQDARTDRHRRPVGPAPTCSTPCRRSSAAAG